MAVSGVISFRIRDGRMSEQLENFKEVKRMVERAGGTFRVYRQLFGSQMNSIVGSERVRGLGGLREDRSRQRNSCSSWT